jgi:hypothetical protein
MGRPSKATAARIEALIAALLAGNTREAAATHADIDRTTLYRWLERDAGLRARVEKAEADAEVRFAAQIARAAGDDWRAGAWWLERRRPKSYGRAQATAAAAVEAAENDTPHLLDALSGGEIRERAQTWAAQLALESTPDAIPL